MRSTICRIFLVIAFASFFYGCAMPSDKELYTKARKALVESNKLPAGAELEGFRKTEIYRAKNAACVELSYEFSTGAGKTETDSYRVWLKRVAMSWELDRIAETPQYSE
jgi:hypothetical protein